MCYTPAMPVQEDYQVSLEAFHGPLDLLLYLIRRAELDVHDIPIASITEQYLAFLSQVDEIDIETAGEFLVMAATLIEIKSRTLMPPGKADDGEDASEPGDGRSAGPPGVLNVADPRAELVQQLLAYQRVRIAAEDLESRRTDFARRYPWQAYIHESMFEKPAEVELELEDVHVLDIAQTYERICSTIDFTRIGDHRVQIDDTPIALHQEDLLDRLSRSPEHALRLQDVFEGYTSGQRVGLFLATLELTRLRRVRVRQDALEEPIEVTLVTERGASDRPNDEAQPSTPDASGPPTQSA
jgi:segregation and condensation protein A